MKIIEDAAIKIRTVLQTNLPAKLDTIDTERGDGIVLDDIAFFSITSYQLNEYFPRPAMFILGENTPFLEISTVGGKRKRMTYIMDLTVVVEDNDEERLQKKLWRYADGVERVLEADRRLGGTVHSIIIKDLLITSRGFTTSSAPTRAISLLAEIQQDYTID
ncbi:MAG: hypothetical protein ACE5HR_00155 [bacterium]